MQLELELTFNRVNPTECIRNLCTILMWVNLLTEHQM